MRIATTDVRPRPVGPDVAWAARRLQLLGIRPGHRVLVCDQSCLELVATLLALVLTDCSIVLADDSVDESSLRHMVDCAAPDVVLARCPADMAPQVAPPPSAWGTAPSLLRAQEGGLTESGPSSCSSCADCPSPARDDALPPWSESLPWAHRDDALILFTSGSSGRPKGVVRSGASMMANISATREVMGYRSDDVLLTLVPATHQYGFSIALLAWSTGCTLALGHPARPEESLAAMSRICDFTVVDAAPSHYEALLAARPRLSGLTLRVRMWCVGGAPCPDALRRRFHQAFGLPLLDGYGMTELGNIALGTHRNPEGVGHPIPGVEVRVVVPSDPSQECAPGVHGRVLVRSDHVFHRYLHGPAPEPLDSWFDTQDLGWRDHDGTLHIIGRIGAVHRHGHTLHLAGLESQLREHGLTAVLVALDGPHQASPPAGDARLVAFVQGTDPRELKRSVRESLPRFAWPNSVIVLDRLPLLTNGKVDRAALSRELAADPTLSALGQAA